MSSVSVSILTSQQNGNILRLFEASVRLNSSKKRLAASFGALLSLRDSFLSEAFVKSVLAIIREAEIRELPEG